MDATCKRLGGGKQIFTKHFLFSKIFLKNLEIKTFMHKQKLEACCCTLALPEMPVRRHQAEMKGDRNSKSHKEIRNSSKGKSVNIKVTIILFMTCNSFCFPT